MIGALTETLLFVELGLFLLPEFLVMGEANGLVVGAAQVAQFLENLAQVLPALSRVIGVLLEEKLAEAEELDLEEGG